MKQNDFYEVDGCMDFIPVTINETYADGVGVIVSDIMRDYRLLLELEQVYRFPKVKELQKPVVPKFVAEWIGYCKFKGFKLLGALDPVSELGVGLVTSLTEELRKGKDWAQRNQETFTRAWLDGYEVEQEKLYVVTDGNKLYLKEFDELNAVIIIDDVVGATDYAKRYSDKAEAQKAADELGWIVKEVE